MKALLMIDIQIDFLKGGALAVPQGNEIIPVVNRLQEKFDLIVATQDWHPPDHKSFASSHPGNALFSNIKLNNQDQVLWPDHCVQGTPGAALAPDLNKNKIEAIFRKGMDPEMDSYSGFYDNGHLKSTGLGSYLRGKNIREVYVAGLAGDYCVYFTAIDALQEGFKTILIEDATRAIDAVNFEKAKADLVDKGGEIISSTNLP